MDFTLKANLDKLENIELQDINHNDAPDFVDANICSAEVNGIKLSEKELDELNENREFVYDEVINFLN
jgi:hypothetical protein